MKSIDIYFQSQSSFNNLCLMHALNNLLGYQAASQRELDKLCTQLSSNVINPHKHFLGGDYDANVLILALQNLGYRTNWLDNREEEKILFDSMIFKEERAGYIINKQCETNWFKKNLGISDRHWIAIRSKDGLYYQLDSKVKQIRILERISDYLKNQIKLGSHIIEVLLGKRQTEQK